jgi:hypothetical protein
MATKTAPVLRVPRSALLPDKGAWTNRFEVRSSSSNRVYVIAQSKTGRHWGCSCPGWCNRRTCKHLTALSLPAFEKPHEVALQGV